MAVNDTLNVFRLADKLSVQQLANAIQTGTLDPNVGQLVLNNKIQAKKRMEAAQAAQAQGQQPQAPIAQQNMAEAVQTPPGMAAGGIVGYAQGGPVDSLFQSLQDAEEANRLRTNLQYKYSGMLQGPSKLGTYKYPLKPEDQQAVQTMMGRLNKMGLPELRQASQYGLEAFKFDPNRVISARKGLFPEEGGAPQDMVQPPTPPEEESDVGGLPAITGAGVGFQSPNLLGYGDILNALGTDRMGKFRDISKQREAELAEGDKETFEGIRKGIDDQKGRIDKSDKQNFWLSLMKAGLATAAGKSQYGLTNIGEGGVEGVNSFVQRDVLNREMENRLAARDQALKLEELAVRKGNRAQADQYASQAQNLETQAQQIHLAATDSQNRNAMGLAGLQLQANTANAGMDLERQRLNQQGAMQSQMLRAREKQYSAYEKAAEARLQQTKQRAVNDFMRSPVFQEINMQFNQKYGPNWRTNNDAKSLEAQYLFKQTLDQYMSQIVPPDFSGGGGQMGGNVPTFDDMMMR